MVNCPVSGENNVVSVSSTCIIKKDNFIPKSGQLIKMNHQITEAHFTTVISKGSVWQFQCFGLTWTYFNKLLWGENSRAESLDFFYHEMDGGGGEKLSPYTICNMQVLNFLSQHFFLRKAIKCLHTKDSKTITSWLNTGILLN